MTQTPIKSEYQENSPPIFPEKSNNESQKVRPTPAKLSVKKTRNNYQKKSTSLSRQLLQTVLPTVLIPLLLASLLGYRNIQEKEEDRVTNLLLEEVLLTEGASSLIVKEVWKTPLTLAKNPLIIQAMREGAIKVKNEGLDQLTIEELEKQFAETKLLQKNEALNNYLNNILEDTGFAEIFFTEQHGFNIAYSNQTSDFVQSDEDWWKKTKNEGNFFKLSDFDESSQSQGLEFYQKITDPQSGEFLGVIKAILPTAKFNQINTILEHTPLKDSHSLQQIDTSSKIAFNTITAAGALRGSKTEIIGGDVILEIASSLIQAVEKPGINLSELAASWSSKYPLTLTIERFEHEDDQISLIAKVNYQGFEYAMATISETPWVAIASIKESDIQQAGTGLLEVFALIGLILGLIATGVVLLLSKHLSDPLAELSETANQIAAGDLTITATAEGVAETEKLAETFNNLISKISDLLAEQELNNQQTKLLAEITEIRELDSQQLNQSFSRILAQARQLLMVDRLVIYRFQENWTGYVSSEALAENWISALSTSFRDPCIPPELIAAYKNGRIVANEDVSKAGFHPEHLALMEDLQIKANLIVPILMEGELFGLLIAHHCRNTHYWQEDEIFFLERIALQLGIALNRINVYQKELLVQQQQRQEKEQLQRRALELLMEVDPVSRGDLTIRASVKEDEIGTIADSYNSTIESLRKIVEQVKTSALEVSVTTSTNSIFIENLVTEAQRQAEEINKARQTIQDMNEIISKIASNAQQAEISAQQASLTVKLGEDAMNRTVTGILTVKNTSQETVAKVRKLGEASEKIAEVINLISRFAAQTHLLALKASIEAARAGEEGVGFAVIADEVRELASQSSQATDQISVIVNEIQSGTTQVIESMESGTGQVEETTSMVEETRQALLEITKATALINQLVAEISHAISEQEQDSQIVNQTITEVAEIAQMSASNANLVAQSFNKLLDVAKNLQQSVTKFKVN